MTMGPSYALTSLFFVLTAFVVCATPYPANSSETSPASTEGMIGEQQARCKGETDGNYQQISYQPQVIINPPAPGAAAINHETGCDCSAMREMLFSEHNDIHLELEQLKTAVSNRSMASSEITQLADTCLQSQGETRRQLEELSSAVADQENVVSSEFENTRSKLDELEAAILNQTTASSEMTIDTYHQSQGETRQQLNTVSSELVDIRGKLDELHTAELNQSMSSLEIMRLVETCQQNQEDTQRQLEELVTAVSNTQGQLEELVTAVSNLAVMLHNHSNAVPLPEDCYDILVRGAYSVSGVYTVQPSDNGPPIQVYCDMVTDGGGWTVFQRRQDGSVDFYRDFESYRRGFGDLKREFWIGNDKLHRITAQGEYELRVDLTDFEDNSAYAVYDTFRVGDVTDSYRLTVEGYSGTAGDSLAHHSNRQFSTKDRDNDASAGSCAQAYHGAWWYGECHNSNLNGEYLGGVTDAYARGVVWKHWKGYYYSLKTSEMKQRRKS